MAAIEDWDIAFVVGGAAMVVKVQKWGNGQGLRLPRSVLKEAGIAIGDLIDVTALDGVIVISPARRKRDLRELVQRIPNRHRPFEADWGKPTGKETW